MRDTLKHPAEGAQPLPAPDLMIAQALMRTENIKLVAGAHLLPYHHPAELACRVAYLDHLARGRLMLGIGAGRLQTDALMFDVDFDAGENRKMTREALEIIPMLWANDGPSEYKGEHWTVRVPDSREWAWASLRHFISGDAQDPPWRMGGAEGRSPGGTAC